MNESTRDTKNRSHFHAHHLRWFEVTIKSEIPYTLHVWRSVSVAFLKGYIQTALGGKRLLRAIYRQKERFPHFFGKWGHYPLFLVQKS